MSTAEKHRSAYLTLVGDGPSIIKLPEQRWQVTYRCRTVNPKTDWWQQNKSRIFADYGTLATAGLPIGAVTSQSGIHLPDLRLVDLRGAPPEQSASGYQVVLVYETLTSTWALEDSDKDSTTENGLKIRTRTQVALPNTSLPTLIVGTTTSGGLILAGKEDDSNDRRGRVITRWAEPGIFSVRESDPDTPFRTIGVSAFMLTEAQVRTELGAKLTGYLLQSTGKGNFKGAQTVEYSFVLGTAQRRVASNNIFSLQESKVIPSGDSYESELNASDVEIDGKFYREAEKTDRVSGGLRYVQVLLNQVPASGGDGTGIPIGELTPTYPLPQSDAVVWQQPFRERVANYARTPLDTEHPTITGAYLVNEVQFRDVGNGMLEWVKQWATIPSAWTGKGKPMNFTFPGLLTAVFIADGTFSSFDLRFRDTTPSGSFPLTRPYTHSISVTVSDSSVYTVDDSIISIPIVSKYWSKTRTPNSALSNWSTKLGMNLGYIVKEIVSETEIRVERDYATMSGWGWLQVLNYGTDAMFTLLRRNALTTVVSPTTNYRYVLPGVTAGVEDAFVFPNPFEVFRPRTATEEVDTLSSATTPTSLEYAGWAKNSQNLLIFQESVPYLGNIIEIREHFTRAF